MARLGDHALHFYMTRGIARLLHLNLGDALRDGRLSADMYEQMVDRCRGCEHAARCTAMLAETVDLDRPPKDCLNDASFRSLRLH